MSQRKIFDVTNNKSRFNNWKGTINLVCQLILITGCHRFLSFSQSFLQFYKLQTIYIYCEFRFSALSANAFTIYIPDDAENRKFGMNIKLLNTYCFEKLRWNMCLLIKIKHNKTYRKEYESGVIGGPPNGLNHHSENTFPAFVKTDPNKQK